MPIPTTQLDGETNNKPRLTSWDLWGQLFQECKKAAICNFTYRKTTSLLGYTFHQTHSFWTVCTIYCTSICSPSRFSISNKGITSCINLTCDWHFDLSSGKLASIISCFKIVIVFVRMVKLRRADSSQRTLHFRIRQSCCSFLIRRNENTRRHKLRPIEVCIFVTAYF